MIKNINLLFINIVVTHFLISSAFAIDTNYSPAELGKLLYFDTSLSKNGTQSCATCHNPQFGFIDNRDNGVYGAVSLGDDGKSLGDRNAPTASYAAFIPNFFRNKKAKYIGGQFYDGREGDLVGQAGGPPTNPLEMGMPDKASVVARIEKNPVYKRAFKKVFGIDVFDNPDKAYTAMAKSIAAFEKTKFFSPFDSKYDRYLKGKEQLTEQEELGRTLFFSKQFTNCNLCHQLQRLPGAEKEMFSNYQYHNIGVPVNHRARLVNGKGLKHIDQGLLENPRVNDLTEKGKFKVPTLRNIAVTGPYMHNGVFKDLKTVVLFYNKYNSRSKKRQINPETGASWRQPEVKENISLKELKTGPALDEKRIDALVAFMKTLTDKRYEHLLQ